MEPNSSVSNSPIRSWDGGEYAHVPMLRPHRSGLRVMRVNSDVLLAKVRHF